MDRVFGGKWRTEGLNASLLLLTLQYVEYSVKLKKISEHNASKFRKPNFKATTRRPYCIFLTKFPSITNSSIRLQQVCNKTVFELEVIYVM